LISVHLDPVADGHSLEHDAELADVTRRLVDLADANQLPLTWGVNDPAHSAATSRILRSPVDHELAILGDEIWLGPTAGRTRFARELARRLTQARAAGIHVTTLMPRVGSVDRHIDLVVKQQITAVAGVGLRSGPKGQLPVARAMHYGVWELPFSGQMPFETRQFVPALWSAWLTWRQIRAAAVAAATYHLLIDAAELVEQGPGALKCVAKVLRGVSDLRNRGLLTVETLSMAARRLSAVPAVFPQQSILRRVA
jgi:hypothetical protein